MKGKVALGLVLTVCFMLAFIVLPQAVHKGSGVLVCDQCHTMHNSQGGSGMEWSGTGPFDYLLRADGTEALCLYCHTGGTYTGAPDVGGSGINPAAGTFDDLDTGDAAGTPNAGNGHNLGEGDSGSITPAGGTAITVGFDCASCHDPHGTDAGLNEAANGIAEYRNLKLNPVGATGTAPTTIAAGPAETSTSGFTGNAWDIDNNFYGRSTSVSHISQWCGTCHVDFYGTAKTNSSSPYIRHPTDNDLGGTIASNFNTVATGVLVPVEAISGSDNTEPTGPVDGGGAQDGVFCLSCHKPHASANADTLRWAYASVGQGSGSGCQRCHNK
jgi:formate-dependent nitrite reductase cytochrome c552 subunit